MNKPAASNKNKILVRIIFLTTLLVGTLDISAAFINSYLRSGVSPFAVLRFIASGVLGNPAFEGGFPTALVGLFFHYFIAFCWTTIFFIVYPRLKISPRLKILTGLVYGIIIWVIMNLIVIPLSNTPEFTPGIVQIIVGICFVMFLVGMPISLMYHKYEMNLLNFKPKDYNSLSPYLIVDGAQKLVDLLKTIFDAKELRRFDRDNGSIEHIELQLDDSVIMISDSTDKYPANTTMLHVYVPDVFKTYKLAIDNGCEPVEQPINKEGDPDTRGGFKDFSGNNWYVSTQFN